MTDNHYANIQARWQHLAQVAAGIQPTRLPLEPLPSEIRAIRDDLEALIRAVDPLIQEYGAYVQAYSGSRIDQSLFKDQLLGALDGNALFEIEEAADELHEDLVMGVA